MRVLVTGAAGFIGSSYVRHLLAYSDDVVTVLDALTYAGSAENLPDPHPRRNYVKGNVCDSDLVRQLVEGQDAVVHLAAETHVERSLLNPALFARTNCWGTSVVCDAARDAGVSKFLYVSTDEVYGPVLLGSRTEQDAMNPRSPYAASKAGAEALARSQLALGLPLVVSRGTNVYGPRQHPEKLVPFFISTLLAGHRPPLHGDGTHVRDWIHVDDCCRGLDTVLRSGVVGETYNLGAGNESTTEMVALALLDTLDLDRQRLELEPDRPGNDHRYSVNTDKIQALGWSPTICFERGLEETVTWYETNREWLKERMGEVHRVRSAFGRAIPRAAESRDEVGVATSE